MEFILGGVIKKTKERIIMANQYTGSFEHKIQQKFQCTAEEILRQFEKENLTYYEVEKRIGFTHGTIRKWARRYGVKLRSGQLKDQVEAQDERFFEKAINSVNFLSRSWK